MRHDQAETQIDIAQRAMTFRRDDRFADDVRQIGPDDEIPIEPDRAQCRTGDETSAHAKESAEHSDDESECDQINRD